MNNIELTRWCAKALRLFSEVVQSGKVSPVRVHSSDGPVSWYACYDGTRYDPLHNAEQNAQLVSWLLRENYYFYQFRHRFTLMDENDTLIAEWDFTDMTIPENRYRAVVEAVGRVMQEREGR